MYAIATNAPCSLSRKRLRELNFEYNDRRNEIIPKEVRELNFEYNDRRNKIIPKKSKPNTHELKVKFNI